MNDCLNSTLELNKKIDELKATKDVRMYKRYLVILMHLEGASNVNIAKMVSLEQHAVGDYIRNYKAKGLPGLAMKHSTGARRKLSKDQEVLIVETVTKPTYVLKKADKAKQEEFKITFEGLKKT